MSCTQDVPLNVPAFLSQVQGFRKVHVVDGVHHELRRDHLAAEPAPVEAANGILAAFHAVELDVDLAVVVVEREADMNDMAVLVLALCRDVFFESLLPAWLVFTTLDSV